MRRSGPACPARAATVTALVVLLAAAPACGGGTDERATTITSTTTAVSAPGTAGRAAAPPATATPAPASTAATSSTSTGGADPVAGAATDEAGAGAGTGSAVEPAPRPELGSAAGGAGVTPADDTVGPAPSTPVAPGGTGGTGGTGDAGFVFASTVIDDALRARMEPTSWRPGCPVGLEDLRYVELAHHGYDGDRRIGELVVHRDVVDQLQDIFARLWAADVRIHSMRLVDDFGGDDDASVAADNTSAFNCRAVTGVPGRWSAHATGRAIDINPLRNPYIGAGGAILLPAAEPYRDRTRGEPGMIVEGDATVAAFDAYGWDWGGRWSSPVDYQHFSAGGG